MGSHKSLLDAGGEDVEAAEHQLDVGAVRPLHRLQLAGQFRRRRLGEGEARDVGRVLGLVGLDRVLQQRERAADVDDVDDERGFRRLRHKAAADRKRGGKTARATPDRMPRRPMVRNCLMLCVLPTVAASDSPC